MRDSEFEMRREREMSEKSRLSAQMANAKVPFGLIEADRIYTGEGQGSSPSGAGCAVYMPDPHQLIRDRVDALAREQHELMILYKALPRELPYEAANALAGLLIRANRV